MSDREIASYNKCGCVAQILGSDNLVMTPIQLTIATLLRNKVKYVLVK